LHLNAVAGTGNPANKKFAAYAEENEMIIVEIFKRGNELTRGYRGRKAAEIFADYPTINVVQIFERGGGNSRTLGQPPIGTAFYIMSSSSGRWSTPCELRLSESDRSDPLVEGLTDDEDENREAEVQRRLHDKDDELQQKAAEIVQNYKIERGMGPVDVANETIIQYEALLEEAEEEIRDELAAGGEKEPEAAAG
jgi:hypothetical protein